MKSRWTTRLLLAAAVTVWSIVAWRIFAPSEPAAPQMRPTADTAPAQPCAADTLRLNYTDPFLRDKAAPKPAPRPTVRPLPPPKKSVPQRDRTPIVHLAAVTADGQTLHVLMIGEVQYELRRGDAADGWRLTGSDSDSLYLEHDGLIYGVKRCR